MKPTGGAARVPLQWDETADDPYSIACRGAGAGAGDRETRRLMYAALDLGDPRAAYAVGTWYLHGAYGLPKHLEAAWPLLRRAAAGGVAEAMYDLGVAYERGSLGRPNRRQAFRWFELAAALGDLRSRRLVASWRLHGYGTRRDDAAALAAYRALAAEGHGDEESDDAIAFLEGR